MEALERAVIETAVEFLVYGQLRASNELTKQGVLISAGGIRSGWMRHDLDSFKKRLKALGAKIGQEGIYPYRNSSACSFRKS